MTERPPRSAWDGQWRPDPASRDMFASLTAGSAVTVVKRAPEGFEVTRYPAAVVATSAPAPWIEVVAGWTLRRVEVAGLAFETGDTLREYFSAGHPYNAFAVISREGILRGWYGNVTYPAFMDDVDGEKVLVWHDLYLDVVLLPDGTTHLLDDEELETSGLPAREPGFAQAIAHAREDLIATIPTLIPSRRSGGRWSGTPRETG